MLQEQHLLKQIPVYHHTPTLMVRLVDDINTLWSRQREWDALAMQSDTSSVFQTFAWQVSWWKTVGSSTQPLILLVEEEGRLVAAAPLIVSQQATLTGRQRVVEFIGTGAADYCDFIFERTRLDTLTSVLAWLAEQHHLWDQLQLINIPEGSATLRLLPEFFHHNRYPVDIRRLYEAPARVLTNRLEDLKVVNRDSMRKAQRYFERQGTVVLKHLTQPEEIAFYLESFFEQHIRRWTSTNTPSLFCDKESRTFYREVARTLAPNGSMVLDMLLFNEVPLAFSLGFTIDNRYIVHKLSFDITYAKRSPGKVFIKNLIEYLIDQQYQEIDFGIGEEAYKYQFSNHVRQMYGLKVFRTKIPYYINRIWLDTKALVKRSPILTNTSRRLIKQWKQMQRSHHSECSYD